MKIGLFGGSSNPVHNQHLAIAHAAQKSLHLEEVWFLPVFQAVHKHHGHLLPFETRTALLEAALVDNDHLRVSTVERALNGPSYTIRTVRHLKKMHPGNDFFLIIGADSLVDLPNWKDYHDLLREVRLAVAGRPGYPTPAAFADTPIHWIPLTEDRVSASLVRKHLAEGRFRGLPIPPPTVAMIISESLYNCLDNHHRDLIQQLRQAVSELPVRLREHVLNVSRLAAQYAAEMGEDPLSGYIAGLAHDLYRLAPGEHILQTARNGGYRLFRLEERHPMLAHGAAAAAHLRQIAKELPPSLLTAIRRHTRPRLQENILCRALVMADALEPSRKDERWHPLRHSRLTPEERYRQVVEQKRLRARQKHQAQTSPLTRQAHIKTPGGGVENHGG